MFYTSLLYDSPTESLTVTIETIFGVKTNPKSHDKLFIVYNCVGSLKFILQLNNMCPENNLLYIDYGTTTFYDVINLPNLDDLSSKRITGKLSTNGLVSKINQWINNATNNVMNFITTYHRPFKFNEDFLKWIKLKYNPKLTNRFGTHLTPLIFIAPNLPKQLFPNVRKFYDHHILVIAFNNLNHIYVVRHCCDGPERYGAQSHHKYVGRLLNKDQIYEWSPGQRITTSTPQVNNLEFDRHTNNILDGPAIFKLFDIIRRELNNDVPLQISDIINGISYKLVKEDKFEARPLFGPDEHDFIIWSETKKEHKTHTNIHYVKIMGQTLFVKLVCGTKCIFKCHQLRPQKGENDFNFGINSGKLAINKNFNSPKFVPVELSPPISPLIAGWVPNDEINSFDALSVGDDIIDCILMGAPLKDIEIQETDNLKRKLIKEWLIADNRPFKK